MLTDNNYRYLEKYSSTLLHTDFLVRGIHHVDYDGFSWKQGKKHPNTKTSTLKTSNKTTKHSRSVKNN